MPETSPEICSVSPAAGKNEVDRREFLRQSSLAAGAVAITSWASAAIGASATEIVSWDADTLSQRIKARDVSCVEVMDAHLAQIRRLNRRVNAIVAMADEEGLRAQAAERDRQLARGEHLGWMHGMPQAIKDTAQAKGFLYTSGSPLLKDNVSTVDSVIAERAKNAGAIIIGKTNVPEWALGSNTFNPVYGTTGNPYDLTKTAGGSSRRRRRGAGGAHAACGRRQRHGRINPQSVSLLQYLWTSAYHGRRSAGAEPRSVRPAIRDRRANGADS
jgi:hypothetical protein